MGVRFYLTLLRREENTRNKGNIKVGDSFKGDFMALELGFTFGEDFLFPVFFFPPVGPFGASLAFFICLLKGVGIVGFKLQIFWRLDVGFTKSF